MNDMVLGHPLAQIAGQKHRRLAVQVDKTCSHAHPSPAVPICSNYFKISSLPKPDRLLAGQSMFEDVSEKLHHRHEEAAFDDFKRQQLLPNRLSQLGPGVAWFDLNNDGYEDLI